MVRRLALLVALLVIALAGGRRTPGPAAAQTPSGTQRLPGHVLGVLGQATKLAPAANAASLPLSLTVVLNRTDEASFRAFLADIQDPNSPNFQQFLSQAELAARFGPSKQAYDATLAYLEQQGFSLVEGSANRLTLTVSGTRAQAEQAFSIQIDDYQLGSRVFYANNLNPAVPASIAPFVQAIIGLSNLAQPEPQFARASPEAAPQSSPAPTPMAFAQAYDFAGVHTAAGAGAGETIGLLEFDNYDPTDVANWLNLVKLPAALASNVSRRDVDGGTTVCSTGNLATCGETEVMLDIETDLGMAQGATIKVYDAPLSASFEDMFNAMIGDKVDVISSSWEACEWQVNTAEAGAMDSILAGGTGSGISIFQASGDHGADCQGQASPPWPGDDPAATGVGGTNLQVTAAGAYSSESWWNGVCGVNSTPCSGGFGLSCCLTSDIGPQPWPAPAYQPGFSGQTVRSTPDVSANADPSTGILICQADDGGCPAFQEGGTSMATPEWAAGIALIDQALGHRIGNADTVLYAHGRSNGFHQPSGMIAPSNDFGHLGLGSFDLGKLLTAIHPTPSASASTAAASPTSVAADGVADSTITVTLLDVNGKPVSGKVVSLGQGSGHSKISGPTPPTTGSNGQAAFQVTDSTPETVVYTATDTTDNNLKIAQTASVTFTPVVHVPIGVSVLPSIASVGASRTLTLSVQAQAPNCTTNGQGTASCLGAWDVTVSFDPTVLSFVRCAANNGTQSCAINGNGQLELSGLSASGLPGGTDLADLTFSGAGAAGTSTPLAPAIALFADPQQTPICASGLGSGTPPACAAGNQPAATAGTVTVGLAGDVNGDGKVDAADALCVLRIVAGLPSTAGCPLPAPGNPDVNNDAAADAPTGADATDALCILRQVAGLSATQACSG